MFVCANPGTGFFPQKKSLIKIIRDFSSSWASRIRTYKMTESESAALPFGYSPKLITECLSLGYELKL